MSQNQYNIFNFPSSKNERLLIAETVKNRDIILNKYLQKYTLIQDRYFNEKSYVLGWLDIF